MKNKNVNAIVFVSLFTLVSANLYAYSGIAPEATLNLRINNSYSLTFKVESQHFLHTQDYGWRHKFNEAEAQLFANYRLNPFVRLGVGYLYEIEPGINSHRTIQQVSLLQRIRSVTLSHRVRSEQTFNAQDPTELRFRYRASMEVPLSGATLDPRELYITSSAEIIYALQDDEREIESRAVWHLGYVINTRYRIQTGFDFRYYFNSDDEPYNLFLKIGYFINL